MRMNKGFIMLFRDLTEWEWYTDMNTCKLFVHCLLKVNYSNKRWQGILIHKGEFITSYDKLAVETGLTVSKVRTALKKLEATGYVLVEATVNYTKIGVLKMCDFVAETSIENDSVRNNAQHDKPNSMPNSKPSSKLLASDSQASNNLIATTNINNNNIINRKKIFREKVFAHTHFNTKILNSFFNYWSELDTDETKMRFEIEQFFEVKKRLDKWQANERPKKNNQKESSELLTNRPNR
ncbi:hypothetical protein ACW5R3_03850 [Bizionia sp. KMM 8389]